VPGALLPSHESRSSGHFSFLPLPFVVSKMNTWVFGKSFKESERNFRTTIEVALQSSGLTWWLALVIGGVTMQLSLRLERLRRWYVFTAVMLLNCVLVAAIGGGVFVLVKKIRAALTERARVSPAERKHGERIFTAYPDLSRDEARTLLWETWTRPIVFEPFTQFKERPFSGRFVNVSGQGFRHSGEQAVWPPDTNAFNVFVFGGSTAFGYGLPDNQTVPSFLQSWMRTNGLSRACVYNFGRAYYYSSQELVLFMRLLAAGHVPHLALFLDGLNDAAYPEDMPEFSDRVRRVMERIKAEPDTGELSKDAAGDVVRRYRGNMRVAKALAEGHGVQVAFIWQPVPTYQYDLQYHPFKGDDFKRHANSRAVYEAMERERKSIDDPSFIWCADMQQGSKEALYVDQVHYSAAFSRKLAERIADGLKAGGLLRVRR
jgi:hypothetical protein